MKRNAAVEVLARINDPSALSAVKAIYKACEDPFIRAYIASVLGPRVEESERRPKAVVAILGVIDFWLRN